MCNIGSFSRLDLQQKLLQTERLTAQTVIHDWWGSYCPCQKHVMMRVWQSQSQAKELYSEQLINRLQSSWRNERKQVRTMTNWKQQSRLDVNETETELKADVSMEERAALFCCMCLSGSSIPQSKDELRLTHGIDLFKKYTKQYLSCKEWCRSFKHFLQLLSPFVHISRSLYMTLTCSLSAVKNTSESPVGCQNDR